MLNNLPNLNNISNIKSNDGNEKRGEKEGYEREDSGSGGVGERLASDMRNGEEERLESYHSQRYDHRLSKLIGKERRRTSSDNTEGTRIKGLQSRCSFSPMERRPKGPIHR
jgi:hypothetical protein